MVRQITVTTDDDIGVQRYAAAVCNQQTGADLRLYIQPHLHQRLNQDGNDGMHESEGQAQQAKCLAYIDPSSKAIPEDAPDGGVQSNLASIVS